MYVSVRVDEYDVWMVWMGSDFNNDEVIAKSQALEAIQNYLNDAHPELAEKLKTGEDDTAIGTYGGDDIIIWVRTDTGSYRINVRLKSLESAKIVALTPL